MENSGKRILKTMQFSLIPSWSKEKRVKFSTYNARLTDFDENKNKTVFIYEKPTWRGAFSSRHCLVPMTGFIEPIYHGDLAGHWVRFFFKRRQSPFCSGNLGRVGFKRRRRSRRIVCHYYRRAYSLVKKMGHGRSPLFLSPSEMSARCR